MSNDQAFRIVNDRSPRRRAQPQRTQNRWETFKNLAILFSFTVNLITVLILLVVLVAFLPIKSAFISPLMGKVWGELVALDNAKIETTVGIDHQLPIGFPVHVRENPTTVRLTAPVPMNMPARFVLPGGGGTINGTVNIVMPAGTQLPVVIEDMTIPISQTIPVQFDQPVTIYLRDTELHNNIVNFQDLLRPFYDDCCVT